MNRVTTFALAIPLALTAAAFPAARATAQTTSSAPESAPASAPESAPESAPASAAVTAPAADPGAPRRWGDVSLTLVQNQSYLAVSGAERGQSDLARGPGLELRFFMPVGWGAYYRHTQVATAAIRPLDEQFEWKKSEFVAGLTRRLLSLGRRDLWSPRVQAHFDFGVGWAQLGTNQRCTRSYVPFGTECSTGPNRPQNVQGDALTFETRVGAFVAYGPLTLGVDVGAAAYLTVTSGTKSISPPPWFFAPSGQLKLGVALPFS